MIVSHKHRFIFLKTKKTAGTSIELALSALCDGDDIITPLAQAEDEPLRRGLAPQNWRRPGLVPAAYRGMAELISTSTSKPTRRGASSASGCGTPISNSPSSAIPGTGRCPIGSSRCARAVPGR